MSLASSSRGRITVLNVSVDDVTLGQAVEALAGWVAEGGRKTKTLTPTLSQRERGQDAHREKGDVHATPREALSAMVVTPNPEMVMRARRDAEFARLLNAADLAVPDGVGLMWAARLLGTPLRERVPGSVLVPGLAERAAAQGQLWFLLGAVPGVAEAAGRALMARYPGLQVVGAFAGDAAPAGDAATRAAIQAVGQVDVLLVAYGAPRQERWMARNRDLGIPVMMGVGGVFNYLAGRSRFAPGWVRRLGFEWLYRLVTEPWRWRRQLALLQFAALVLVEAVRRRLWRRRDSERSEE